jgi:hypothetical protein
MRRWWQAGVLGLLSGVLLNGPRSASNLAISGGGCGCDGLCGWEEHQQKQEDHPAAAGRSRDASQPARTLTQQTKQCTVVRTVNGFGAVVSPRRAACSARSSQCFEALYWSYANLAMAHAAVREGAANYTQTHFIIRSRLYKGLSCGSMSIGGTFRRRAVETSSPTGLLLL